MKLHKLKCPNCNGMLKAELVNGKDSVYCPYCGQEFYVDDGKRTVTINKNININNTYRKIDDAEIIRAKTEANETKNALIAVGLCFGFVLLMLGGWELFDYLKEENEKKANKISAGYYRDYENQNYETVVKQFELMGFKNIDVVDLNDSGLLFWQDGVINSISINGDSSFEENDYFYCTDKVIITYH